MDLSRYSTLSLVPITCDGCGQSFCRVKRDVLRNLRDKRKNFCTRECYKKAKTFNTEISCKKCNKLFSAPTNKNRKFCSKKCSAELNNIIHGKRRRKLLKCCLYCGSSTYAYKYCNTQCQQNYLLWLRVENGTASSHSLKRFLLKESGHKCWRCNNTEWNNLPIALELEHIDGNSSNNILSNLELLCPNCHAQTSTYKGRNKGNGRHSRRVRYQEGKSY
jgi:hypothetical protein